MEKQTRNQIFKSLADLDRVARGALASSSDLARALVKSGLHDRAIMLFDSCEYLAREIRVLMTVLLENGGSKGDERL